MIFRWSIQCSTLWMHIRRNWGVSLALQLVPDDFRTTRCLGDMYLNRHPVAERDRLNAQ